MAVHKKRRQYSVRELITNKWATCAVFCEPRQVTWRWKNIWPSVLDFEQYHRILTRLRFLCNMCRTIHGIVELKTVEWFKLLYDVDNRCRWLSQGTISNVWRYNFVYKNWTGINHRWYILKFPVSCTASRAQKTKQK